MITLIGAFIGFISSALPDFLRFFQEKQDRKHELAVMKMQIEQQRIGHNQKLEAIRLQADLIQSQEIYRHASRDSGNKYVEALRASVRPIITYAFFLLFATVKIASLVYLVGNGHDISVALLKIWDSESQALFAAVMSFWFGQRAFRASKGNIS